MYCIQREAVTSMEQRPPLPPEQAVEYFADTVLRAAFGMVKNLSDAEDIAQDTFVSLVRASRQFESLEHQKAWLLRVAINRAKDISRSFWKKNRLSIEDYADAVPFESREETGLFEAVMRLPEKYREVIHLYYYEDLSIKETARILRITEGSVKMRLSRGRSFLRDVFKEEES